MAMVFVHYRAAVVAFTYDESWSFNAFARADWQSTLWNLNPVANNHILHSLLMRISWLVFGVSEYALRIPVLLAHLLFLWVSFKLTSRYLTKYAVLAFFALNFQPYLLDYFVTARGYGLSISFVFVAYYFLLQYWSNPKGKYLLLIGLFSSLAVWANFSYLLVFISLLGISAGLILYKKKSNLFHWNLLFLAPIVLLYFIYNPLKRLIEKGELFFGGTEGFYSDTVLSLSNRMLYDLSDSTFLLTIYPAVVLVFLGLGFILIRNRWRQNSKEKIDELSIHILLFLSPIIGSVLLHHLLAKPYLIERTALFILPFSLVFIFAVMEKSALKIRKPLINNWVSGILMVFIGLNFIQSINFTYVVDFKEHSDTRKALLNLQEIRKADGQDYFVIGKSKYMNATMNYYKFKEQLNFMPGIDLRFCNDQGPYPYYYLFEEDKNCIEDLNLELIEFYPVSKTYLFRNESFIKETIKNKTQ